jgi:hypothetical protein
MNKTKWLKIILLAFSLIVFTRLDFSQQARSPSRKETVDSFLQAWLVRKDQGSALKFFHGRAILSKDILSVPCWGDVFNEGSQNPAQVRRGVRKFLEDSSESIKGNTLDKILFLTSSHDAENSLRIATAFRRVALNSPKVDKYYLVSYKTFVSAFPDPEAKYFLRNYDLRDAFFSVIQYRVLNIDERYGDDVLFTILWAREVGAWRIVSVTAACN